MRKCGYLILMILFFCLSSATKAEGASLYLSPGSGEYSVATSFSVAVKVNSASSVINVVSATITYPTDLLDVKSVSKGDSVLKLWTKEPSFSNSSGTLSFSGGVTAPGFSGIGNSVVITFVAKKEGQAQVSFSSGTVLAADGKGTNILSSKSGATYLIKKKDSAVKPVEPAKPVQPQKKVPPLIEIKSATHPNNDQWYSNQNPSFSWTVPAGLTGISIDFDNIPSTIPDHVPDEVSDSKSYNNINDGVWYFHLRLKNNEGWNEASHFKVQIDSSPPNDFEIKIDNGNDKTNPKPSLYFEGTDNFSGLSHYDIKIDDDYFSSAMPSETNPFIMPLRSPGSHKVIITAIDKSGNRKDVTSIVEVESIQIPEITVYPSLYNAGE